jgi:hypothetical protein
MLEIILLEFDLPNMFTEMSNDEFDEWLNMGLFLPVDILKQCLLSTLKDLEESEQYEKCQLLLNFLKIHCENKL